MSGDEVTAAVLLGASAHPRRTQPLVVVADDDPGIRTVVAQLLQANGFAAHSCADGQSALEMVRQLHPVLVMLDIKMPIMDGLTACRSIRDDTDVPIIMITAVSDEGEAARALDAGADDYIRKPFGAQELVSRVKAVVRRSGARGSGDILSIGKLRLDETQRIAAIDEAEVHLTSTEFDLLAYMAHNLNRVVTYGHLLDHVWGYDYPESRQAVRLVIHRLRRKIGDATDVTLETMSGVGYRLRGPKP